MTTVLLYQDLTPDQQRSAAEIWHDAMAPADYCYELDGAQVIGRIRLVGARLDGTDRIEHIPHRKTQVNIEDKYGLPPALPRPVRSATRKPKRLTRKEIERGLAWPGSERRRPSALRIAIAYMLFALQDRRASR